MMASPAPRSVEFRLAQLLGAIACVALVGVLLLLPYRLYERDIRNASEGARRVSSVVHTALARSLADGGNIDELVGRLQQTADFEIDLEAISDADGSSKGDLALGSSELDGTDLAYVTGPIRNASGETWRSTMHFDLSSMKQDSIRLIIDLMLAVTLGSLGFSLALFWLIRSALIQPIRRVTRRIEAFEQHGEELHMPEFHSSEMRALSSAIERACQSHGSAP